jgi:hypothetical protein
MSNLTDDQIQEIRSLSIEAENFKKSKLYQKLEETVDKTKNDIMYRLVNNVRLKDEENLTRTEFVERLCAQIQTIRIGIDVIAVIAEQRKELDKMKVEEPEVKDVKPETGKHPSHGQ